MPTHHQNVIYVYDKNKNLLAVFGEDAQGINQTQTSEGLSEAAMRELMVAPTVHIESNGASTFSFQMLANATKWQIIKNPENLYFVNGRYYTPMTENAYKYSGVDTARMVEVTCVETWYMLANQYKQVYNCGIYVQCKGQVGNKFEFYSNGSIKSMTAGSYPQYFEGKDENCSNPSNTISYTNAALQVSKWAEKDKDGNPINYRLVLDEKNDKDAWLGAPQIVNLKRLSNVNSERHIFLMTNPVRPTMKIQIPIEKEDFIVSKDFDSNGFFRTRYSIINTLYEYFQQRYGNNNLKINKDTYYIQPPDIIKSVKLSYTNIINNVVSDVTNADVSDNEQTFAHYTQTSYEDEVVYKYTSEFDWLEFKKPKNFKEHKKNNTTASNSNSYQANYANDGTVFNYLTVEFEFPNMGACKKGKTPKCTLAYGAEVVDEHTFIILPKADGKYKLTINGIEYTDSQIRDIRGTHLPRGSAGYAMWAALQNTGWQLGICDVMPKDFNPSIDYGVFNVETDMKDVLSIIHHIQSLYGGILDWDSEHQILNYRAENSDDYVVYNDDFNKWRGYQFREGKNFTDQPTITYDNNIITKAYILGYDNLNIKKVNNGLSYITNNSFTKEVIEGYLQQDLIYDTNDESGQKQLLYWGRRELTKQCKPRTNIEFSATDLRTVNGLEHEIFDINHIVEARYRDSHDNTEHIEKKRVILWEYNVFAMWDCQVELGDKTQNEIELFKLIYNKALNTPGTNGSGQISSGNICLVPSINNNPNSVGGQFNLISQTITDNSTAIAGLIVDTSSSYSYAQLFAEYQKKTDKTITNAYAGLEFYADAKKAQAVLQSKYYTKNYVTGEIAVTEAALKTYADKKGAEAILYAKGVWEDTQGLVTEATAEVLTKVSKTYATAQMVSDFKQEVDGRFVHTNAIVETYADATQSLVSQVATYKNDMQRLSSSVTSLANKQYTMNIMLSELEDNLAYVYTYVDETIAEAGITAEMEDALAYVRAIAGVDEGYRYSEVHISGDLFIDSGKTFYYGDRTFFARVGWTEIHTENGNGAVLGIYGQGTIVIPGGYIS